jgi:hypothetical protein
MPAMSTNSIRHFADRVRGLVGNNKELVLSAQDAKNLNHEIQQLLARYVELESQVESGQISVEVSAPKF